MTADDVLTAIEVLLVEEDVTAVEVILAVVEVLPWVEGLHESPKPKMHQRFSATWAGAASTVPARASAKTGRTDVMSILKDGRMREEWEVGIRVGRVVRGFRRALTFASGVPS